MEYYFGRTISIKNYQVLSNVPFVLILLIAMDSYQRRRVKLVGKNSMEIVL
jgi:hypothetical protein